MVNHRGLRFDLPVWMLVAAMLAAGWAVKSAAEGRRVAFSDPRGTIRLAYPAGWIGVPGSTKLLEVRGPGAAGGFPDTIALTRDTVAPAATVQQAVEQDVLRRHNDLSMYRVLGTRKARIGGRDGMLVRFAFVADPFGAEPGADRFPVAVGCLEAVVIDRGALYRLRFLAAVSRFPQMERLAAQILRTVSF